MYLGRFVNDGHIFEYTLATEAVQDLDARGGDPLKYQLMPVSLRVTSSAVA
jgi:hypothetical protein